MPDPSTDPAPNPIPNPATGPSIREFQQLIRDRYLASDAARGSAGTFLWFTEEVGELASALAAHQPGKSPTADQTANLAEEFADVLAWLTTLANIHGVDLAAATDKYFDPARVEGVKD